MEEKGKEIREELRQDEAKKILDTINDEYGINKVRDLIKDNKIEFEYNEKQYRTRLLTTKEKDELDYLRRKKFGQLIQDKDILMEKDLINIYKERGIDIAALDRDKINIERQIADVNYRLGEALTKEPDEGILKSYRMEIEQLSTKLYEIVIQKNHLLDYSLENQLINYVAKVASYLSLDILIGESWSRAFNDIEYFLSTEERLINAAALYSTALNYKA